MNTFLATDEFNAWLSALRDPVAKARIAIRIRSAEQGNFGDCEPVGGWRLRNENPCGRRIPRLLHAARQCCLSAAVWWR